MSQIILTEDQAKALAPAIKPVPVYSADGKILGTFTPLWNEEDIVEAKRILASGGPWSTTAEVLARIAAKEKP